MALTFKDLLKSDASSVHLNVNEFAETVTFYSPTRGTGLTENQLRSLAGLAPVPDGDCDAEDRRQLLGLFRFGDRPLLVLPVPAIVNLEMEDTGAWRANPDSEGDRIIREGRLKIHVDVEVVVNQRAELRDYVVVRGERWECLHFAGRGIALKTLVIRRDEKIVTKRPAARR